jgi:hypothetical protein
MLLGEMRRDPDNRHGFKARRIGQGLAEMAMIRSLQLILDQHPATCPDVLTEMGQIGLVGATAAPVTVRRMSSRLKRIT